MPTFTALSSAWLFLLTIPLVVFYFLKLRRPRQVIPSLVLWRQVLADQRVNSPFQKFKRNLLLLLQLLLLALLVLATMQPVLRRGNSSATRLPVLLDISASMAALDKPGGQSRLAAAKARVRELIDTLPPDQEVSLIAFAKTARRLTGFTNSKAELREALATLKVEDVPGDIDEALRLAQALTRTDSFERVWLISDGNFPARTQFELPFRIEFQRVAPAGSNFGLTACNARRDLDGTWKVFVQLSGSAEAESTTGTVELREGERVLGSERVSLAKGSAPRLSFHLASAAAADLEVRYTPEGFDSLASDNAAWLHLPAARPLSAFAPESLASVRHALEATAGVELAEKQAGYDLVITDREADLATPARVVCTLGLVPEDLRPLMSIEKASAQAIDWRRDAPVLQHVSLDDVIFSDDPHTAADVTETRFPELGYTILADGPHGPLLVEKSDADQLRVHALFHPDRSTFVYRVGFPVFVSNLVQAALRRGQLSEVAAAQTGALAPHVGKDAALLSAQETSLAGVDQIEFAEQLKVTAASTAPRVDRSLWWPIACAALVLLALEWWFFNRRAHVLRVLLAGFLTAQAHALEVKEIRWSFDGKVVPARFNLLSVLVDESGPRPFDGELSLLETRGSEQSFGAPLVQPLYLTPGTQRWVQFVPFVSQEFEWRLSWGKGDKARVPVPAPKFGAPATVLLLDLASPFATGAAMSVFPEDIFPTSVAATDGLDQVALDHVPRWDTPRREAFLDWLRRGGIVHILRGPGGVPVFEDALAALNGPATKTRVGAGTVVRHDAGREECNERFLAAAGFPVRELKKADGSSPVLYRFDQTLLQNLASLTKPDVQWWLLYLLTLGYLVVIGPVHYRWSRTVDYRVAIGGFLGTVAVFAVAFIVAGHRGSGEKQTSHSLAIAHSLGGDRWDVQQWVSAFATKGDFYKLTHAAPANFYSATNETEAVNGRCVGGKDGHFDVDIPLYSARPFLHRAVMTGPKAEVKVVKWKDVEVLDAHPLSLDSPPAKSDHALPDPSARFVFDMPANFHQQIEHAYAFWHGQFCSLSSKSHQLVSIEVPGDSEKMFFKAEELQKLGGAGWGSESAFSPIRAFHPLVARFLGDVEGMPNPITRRSLSSDHVLLFLFAEAPESFAVQGKGFDRGHGHVLYVIDVFRPAGEDKVTR